MFATFDFIIFGLFLTSSLVVGFFHGIRAHLRKKTLAHSETSEFLTGGRKLSILPVCLSLLTSFISGIALLGVPSEIYQRGMTMGTSFFTGAVSFLLSGVFFVPVFYKLQLISVYEYLELRFDSKNLRKFGSGLFLLSTFFYMAVVMYAPSIALSGVTNIPLWPLITSVGIVATVYTAVGGIKAVIWTDTLQAVFMYTGIGVLVVKGVMDAGGLSNVYDVAKNTGRTSEALLRFDPNIFQYGSIWIVTLGSVFHWTCFYGLNQMALQRYCSLPSLRDARIVMGLTVPAFWVIGIMVTTLGLTCVAYFHGCNPVGTEIDTFDQIVILLASRVLAIIPGLPGMFLAALYSSTLSTTSSGLNSMTAVLFEDFLADKCRSMSQSKITIYMRITTVVFGILSTVLAFTCDYLGGIFNAMMTTLIASGGPLVGVFFLGIFSTRANKNGAFIGMTAALILMLVLSLASIIQKPYKNYLLPFSTQKYSNPNCAGFDVESRQHETFHISVLKNHSSLEQESSHADWHYGDPDALTISKLSPLAYAIVGVLTTIVIGYISSLVFPVHQDKRTQKLAHACTYSGLDEDVDKSDYRDVVGVEENINESSEMINKRGI